MEQQMLYVALLLCFGTQIVYSSYLNQVIKHDLKGQSLGRQSGKEVYEYEGHVYSFHLDALSWDEALLSCATEGGYLAVLEDIQEVDFVSNAMDGNLCSFAAFQNVWIGGRFNHEKERWYWKPTGYEIMGKVGSNDGYPPWKVNLRPGYDCLNLDQDLTHKPKFTDLECFRRRRYLCEEGCSQLYDTPGGHWEPSDCVSDVNHISDNCQLVCNPGYELVGDNNLVCSSRGWNSTEGFNKLPRCRNGDEIADEIVDEVRGLLEGDVELLFVLDESETPGLDVFNDAIAFSKAIVRAFPLSSNRSAGLITYGDAANVRVKVNTDVTCKFLTVADKVSPALSEGNNLENGLTAARQEIVSNKAHNKTVIFVIAGSSNSSVDATSVAQQIKQDGDVIITIGVAEGNRAELRAIASKIDDRELFYAIYDDAIFAEVDRVILKEFGDNFPDDCSDFGACDALDDSDRGHWEPAECTSGPQENAVCTLVCNTGFSVHGPSKLTCSDNNWIGPVGPIKELPECYTPDEVGGDFGDEINRTLSEYAGASLLFVLDESGSVGTEDFKIELSFVEAIVNAFPLSVTRRAGLITFSTGSKVDIPLTADDTCAFIKLVEKVQYEGGNTDILNALQQADLETQRNNPDNKTLVFLVTDGRSSTNPTSAADAIKSRGNLLFTVGVANFDETQLIPISTVSSEGVPHFFGVSSFEVFQVVADYLNTTYNIDNREDCSITCKVLQDSDRGHWEPATCTQSPGETGRQCSLVCNPEYELRGSNPLVCGEQGWTGTAGDFKIPKCETPEEIGGDFVDKINSTLAGGVNSNLLFVIDESGSVGTDNFAMEIDFAKAVVQAFPLSENRSAGIITFSSAANVDIPLNVQDTCGFLAAADQIIYSDGGTDILKGLQLASSEITSHGTHNQTLVFLITDGISSTDPTSAANALKQAGHVMFAVGVAGYQQAQLEPLTSVGPDGTTNFFGIKSFDVFQVIADYLNSTYTDGGLNCGSRSSKLLDLDENNAIW